jgi:ribosomal protein L21E
MSFKAGDRVAVYRSLHGNGHEGIHEDYFVGDVGTVVGIGTPFVTSVAVNFDTPSKKGRVSSRQGYAVDEGELVHEDVYNSPLFQAMSD